MQIDLSKKQCTNCGVQLSEENTLSYCIKRRNYKCSECHREHDRNKKKANYKPEKQKYINARQLKKIKENDPVRYSAQKMVYGAKQRARKLNLPFDLTVEYLIGIMPERCPVFDEKLLYGGEGCRTKFTASIDKIKPELGYIKGNVQIISNLANMMKQNASFKELVKFANWIMRN